MSEADPLAEHLSRFTPDGAGLDRDALLFAAGRASARPSRAWVAAAGALAASQLLTLTLLWPRPAAPVGTVIVTAPAPSAVEPPPPEATALWVLNRRVLQVEGSESPPAVPVNLVFPTDPPLRAFAARLPADLF